MIFVVQSYPLGGYMILVGFSHQARVGKDLGCDYLVDRYGFTKLSFAEALYEECRNLFIVVRREVSPPEHWSNGNGKHWDYSGMVVKDPTLLQWWGTNVRRAQDLDYWVNELKRKIDVMPKNSKICINDVRFPNEAKMIEDFNGYMLRIIRPDRPIDRDPNHPSEVSLLNYPWKHTIRNTGTIKDYYKKLDDWLVEVGIAGGKNA